MRKNGIAESIFKSARRCWKASNTPIPRFRRGGPFAARVVVHPNVHSFALDDDDDEALEKGTLFLHAKNNGRRRSRGAAAAGWRPPTTPSASPHHLHQ